VWVSIVKELKYDWTKAYEIPPRAWEEIIAGAFKEDGFDDVTLTPRSGDHGRDVIAYRRGVGTIKVIGSVKAYKPGLLVGYDDVRALLGVMTGERDTSKGIITTTSDFPPNIMKDPFIAPFVPYRLELMNGKALQEWLKKLAQRTWRTPRGREEPAAIPALLCDLPWHPTRSCCGDLEHPLKIAPSFSVVR
jgi:restriction system protein